MIQFILILAIPSLLALFVSFLIGRWQDKETRDVINFGIILMS